MNLIHSVETLSRLAGGLPIAVTELAQALAEADPDSSVRLVSPASPQREDVTAVDNVSMTRIEPGPLVGMRTRRELAELHRWSTVDVVHQHGIWAPLPVMSGRFASQEGVPLVLSPHGMLEEWARSHHAWRKRIAWKIYQQRNLDSAAVLVASADSEAEQFRQLGCRQAIAVITHGVAPLPDRPMTSGAKEGERQVLFLSRIHPKKGLDLLLDAWATVDAPDWRLIIVGNDDGGHRKALEAQAKHLRISDQVRFVGPLFDEEKEQAFRSADLFVLPSHSENFGIVVAEALQYGLPVITTSGTPWRHITDEKCGWCVDPNAAAIGAAIQAATSLSDDQRRAMGERGKALIDRDHRWPKIAEQYWALYHWLAGTGPEPDDLRRD